MAMKVTNYAVTTLSAMLLAAGTTLTVATGAGALFPTLASDYFYCSLTNAAASANEIVKVTARSGDIFTIVRAQDNTTAANWAIGDKCELRVVAVMINDFPKLDEANVFTQPQTVSTGVASGHAVTVGQWQAQGGVAFLTAGTSTAYTLTPVPAITSYVANQSFYVTFNAASGAAPTLQINGIATPPNLVRQLPDGTYQNIAAGEVPINHRSRVTLLSATQAWVEEVLPGSEINAALAKVTPVDADTMALIDSAASNILKKVTWANVKATLDIRYSLIAGSFSIVTVGAVTAGTWNASVVTGQYGGTGVANTGKTITLGGNLTTSGAFATTFNIPGAFSYTFPGQTDTLAALGLAQTYSKAQRGAFVTLTDAATVAMDLSLANQFNLVLAGNRTMGVPTNVVPGQQGVICVYQDTTGTRTLAYSWIWAWAGGTAGTLSTAGCTRDFLAYSVDAYATGTVTITIATPGVITLTGHGLISGNRFQLTTTGALPTGLTASTTYFARVIDANTFNACTTLANVAAGTYIATSGTQSGVHTAVAGSVTLALSGAVP